MKYFITIESKEKATEALLQALHELHGKIFFLNLHPLEW